MIDYKEVMCCNCKECIGEKIIKYRYGNCEITRCENFFPKYKFEESAEDNCALFVDLSSNLEYNNIEELIK